jgi:hypothetical protein
VGRAEKDRLRPRVIRYFELAHAHARRFHQPLLISVGGLSGSGKSTLARLLGARLGAELIRTDEVRKEIHRVASSAEDLYSDDATRRTYAEAGDRAKVLLAAEEPWSRRGRSLAGAEPRPRGGPRGGRVGPPGCRVRRSRGRADRRRGEEGGDVRRHRGDPGPAAAWSRPRTARRRDESPRRHGSGPQTALAARPGPAAASSDRPGPRTWGSLCEDLTRRS